MPLITWNDSLSVKIAAFDKDHQKLLGLLNSLFDAITTGVGKEVLDTTFDELVSYTKIHFRKEEDALRRYAYPKYDEQVKEHAEFTSKILEYQNSWKEGHSGILSRELLQYLKDWLLKHIQGSDRQYSEYLISKGMR